MPNYVVLDKSKHKSLKVKKGYSVEAGDNVHMVDVYPSEFRSLMSFYPILLTKSAMTGEFIFISVFGLEENENLFLQSEDWNASYVPLAIRKAPFAVTHNEADGKSYIVVDEESKKLSEEHGESFIDEDGNPLPYLQNVEQMLLRIAEGKEDAKDLIAFMEANELIQPITFKAQDSSGDVKSFSGLYSLNEEKFNALSKEMVGALHENGALQLMYYMLASMSQLAGLVHKKNSLSS